MTWTKLLASRDVQSHRTSKRELDDFRALIARDLADAAVALVSADRRFARRSMDRRQGVRRPDVRETWAESMREQRRSGNEGAAKGAIRLVISGQAVFQSASGSYGEMRCLGEPASCLPGSKAKAMLPTTAIPAEGFGYRHSFRPGAAAKGKGKQTGLIATWAYTAEPIEGKYGRKSFCGDYTGAVCMVAGPTMPPVVGGACPKSCQPLP